MKPPKELSDKWEAILASEGMAEICLFDNTGKNARAVQFVSASCEEGNNDWFEHVNIQENGCVLRFEDTPTAVASRKLSNDVASLPAKWPSSELVLLRAWSESGNFLDSCNAVGISLAQGWKIRRRFEKFVKDSIQ